MVQTCALAHGMERSKYAGERNPAELILRPEKPEAPEEARSVCRNPKRPERPGELCLRQSCIKDFLTV